MRTITFTETVELNTLQCANCGVLFAITAAFEKHRRETGEAFWCPNGHNLSYHDTLKQRLIAVQADLERRTREMTAAKCELLNERTIRQEKEKLLLKHRTRSQNGVCVCCNRSFTNLRRHMATKHPEKA